MGVKGTPVRVFENQVANALSDISVDCREANAINVLVIATGASIGATVSVEGSEAQGGNYLALADPNASKAVTASTSFDVVVGTAFIKIRIASRTGGSFTVIVTPYISPGQATININNTASQNLAQYGGSPVGPGNPVDVQLQGTPTVNTELPAAAALADGAANPTAPIAGAAELVFNGATWDRKRVATVFKPIAAQAVTANTPVDVWTPATGKKFRLMGYALSLSVAGSVILKDNTTEILRTPLMAAGIGLVQPEMGNGILSAAADQVLKIDVTASGSVSGYLYGTEE